MAVDDDLRKVGPGDDDLRERFTALRRAEEANVPEFAWLAPSGVRFGGRWSAGALIAVTVCLVVMAAAVWFLQSRQERRSGTPVASLSEWKAPTDFLLETPGREVLRTVPAIGLSRDYLNGAKSQEKPRAASRVSH
jgi:hypothetical protein